MSIRRRTFLQYLALASGSAACGCGAASEQPGGAERPDGGGDPLGSESEDVDMTLFPYGVLAGDMEATAATAARAVFWTRCLAGSPLSLMVWEKSTMRLAFDGPVDVEEGGFAHHDVASLAPGVRYRYQFRAGKEDGSLAYSSAGELEMPPAPGTRPVVTFGAVSCTHQAGAPGSRAVGHAANLELDCFFHLGDHVYNDSRDWLTTLSEFRDSWQECFDLPYMRAFHGQHGLYFTWDDHEIINNWDWDWVDANPIYRDSVKYGTQTYFEHHPLRRNQADPDRLWRSVKWGDTAEFFLLDLRSERREDIDRHMLSRAQMEWLEEGLASSTAAFKFIMNPIPVCTMPPEDTHVADRWEGFERERTEILAWIRDRHIRGVWWISGDYHVGAVGRIDPYGYRWYGMREVMMGPGAGPGAEEAQSMAAYTEGLSGEKQWPFVTDASNYVVLTADPEASTLRVQFHDGAGRVIHDQTYPGDDDLPADRALTGAIAAKHAEKQALLGAPLTDAHATLGGTGSWQQFQYGYVYESPQAGAFEVHGAILDHWASEGWSASWLGYPVTDTYTTRSGDDEQEFEHGWVTRNGTTGAITTRAK